MALVKLFHILITLCSAMKDMMWTTDGRRRTWCKRQKHFTLQFSICGGEARGESNYPELPGPGEPHYIVKLGEDGQTCRPCLAMLWRIQYSHKCRTSPLLLLLSHFKDQLRHRSWKQPVTEERYLWARVKFTSKDNLFKYSFLILIVSSKRFLMYENESGSGWSIWSIVLSTVKYRLHVWGWPTLWR